MDISQRTYYCQDGNITNISLQIQLTLSKSLQAFFAEIDKLVLKLMWKCKGLRRAKTILKRTKLEELTPPDFKTYHKATVIDTCLQTME